LRIRGHLHLIPALLIIAAKAAFSDKKPYPGWLQFTEHVNCTIHKH
jgi:hypothetical protein